MNLYLINDVDYVAAPDADTAIRHLADVCYGGREQMVAEFGEPTVETIDPERVMRWYDEESMHEPQMVPVRDLLPKDGKPCIVGSTEV